MKISTEIGSIASLVGEERAVELVAKAGFDAWDFSMFDICQYDWEHKRIIENGHPFLGNDYLAFARKLKQIGLDNGIVCNQTHAPFSLKRGETLDESNIKYLNIARSIEAAGILGAKYIIVHLLGSVIDIVADRI